ncbi:MAG: bifunctional riboflavin kinase/FAD synthetase [Caulobacterales bacterium]
MTPDNLKISVSDAASSPDALAGAYVALGNFDGVHKGHQAVAGLAVAAARKAGRPSAAAVFTPHPRAFFQPEGPPLRLQSDAQRARALRACGVDHVVEIVFDAAMANLSPDAFADIILQSRLNVAGVAVGLDFRYGKGRAGDVASLAQEGQRLGFAVAVADAVDDADHPGDKISSSAIRTALAQGDVAHAARLLGRPWAVEGTVIEGAKRGRTINFPTANIALGTYVRPAFGVYAMRVRMRDGTEHGGVANVGVKPTVQDTPASPLLETHLFDVSQDLYGQTLEVAFEAFIRPEKKFESFEALTTQIAADAATARRLLSPAAP